MNKVYVKKVNNLEKDTKELINKLGIKRLPSNSKIFIKINLSLDRNYPGTTTSPDILRILVKELSKKYNVLAGDSDPSACKADLALKVTGTGEAIKKGGGTAINLSKDKKVLVNCRDCKKINKWWMPASVINADAVISLALLKTHVFTTITGTIKNMFGTYPGLKILHHRYLDKAIHDSLVMTKPSYAIIDGRIGMEGRGPVEGTPVKTGLIIGSNNPVSCDSEASKIMGFDPKKINHIQMCNKTLKGMNYKLIGPRIRQEYKPADKGFIDKVQEWTLKHNLTTTLCFKTPLFKTIKWGAKTIKDINRWRRIR
jgi:uncharacterized protein (DUF362 family)